MDEAAVDYFNAVRQDVDDILRPPAGPESAKDKLLESALQVIQEMGDIIQQGGFDSRSLPEIALAKQRAVSLCGAIAMELSDGGRHD